MIAQPAIEWTMALRVRAVVRGWVEMDKRYGRDCDINPETLRGGCAIASYTLWRAYKKLGIKSRLANNDDHCWIEAGGIIIDVTATQFSKKVGEIFIAPVETDAGFYDYRNPQRRGKRAREDLKDWWIEQRPDYYKEEIKKFIAKVELCHSQK